MLSAKRVARVDFSQLSDAEAEALLARYAYIITAEVKRYSPRLKFWTAFGNDDLYAVAQIAALEAHLTWRADGGSSRPNWVGRVIRWRLTEMLQGAPPEAPPTISLEHTHVVDAFGAHARLPPPDSRLALMDRRECFENLVGRLSPRRRTIVACYLAGETFAQIAATLGVGHQFVAREYANAIAELRKLVESIEDPLV